MEKQNSIQSLQSQGFEINSEIVFSTAHLSEACAKALSEESSDEQSRAVSALLVYPHGEFGFRIFVPKDRSFQTEFPELNRILRLAQGNEIAWVLFDCDGLKYEQFPTFDW